MAETPKPPSSEPTKEVQPMSQKQGKMYVIGFRGGRIQQLLAYGAIGVVSISTGMVLTLFVLSQLDKNFNKKHLELFNFPETRKQEYEESRDKNSELERLDREMKSYFNSQYYSMY